MKYLCFVFSMILFLELPVIAQSSLAKQPVSLSVYKTSIKLKISGEATGYASGVKINGIDVTLDTSIKVSPKTAYLSIDFSSVTGSSLEEVLNGNNSFWIVDKAGKSIKSDERFLKKVNGSMENETVNYTVKIPFKLKTDMKNIYTIRYLWESKDKKKTIDIVASK
ncbi:MAG: hypothetical protein ABIT07_08655 [Ferruginibacter sp.]